MRDIKLAAYSDSLGRAAIEVFNIRIENGVIKAFEYTDNGEESECKIVQFTGLTDCNGVEVYEGDVLKCLSSGLWVCEWNNESAGFGIQSQIGTVTSLWGSKHFEVIGNIYQNPELLENNQ